jgi:Bacterial TSP3 repeat
MKINKKNKRVSGNRLSQIVVFLVVVIFAWTGLSRANLTGLNIFQDNDQDGLTNEEEKAYGTDPENSDTDGDGYSDKVEIESGYDPLKPAPGDKLITENVEIKGDYDENNLTDAFFEKIEQEKGKEVDFLQTLSNNPESLENEDVLNSFQGASLTNEDVERYVQEVNQETDSSKELELISEDEIEILPKPTGSEEEIKEKEKKQIEEYMTAMSYVLVVNSPFSLREDEDLSVQAISLVGIVSGYFDDKNQEELGVLKETAEKVFLETKRIETPEVLKDIHLSSLSLYDYLLKNINEDDLLDEEDPLKMISSLGKVQAALIEVENIKNEMSNILEEYEIDNIAVPGIL